MKDCIFCKIIAGEIAATFAHRDEDLVAIEDLNPQAPTHLLLIPREHIPRAFDLKPEHTPVLGKIFAASARLAEERGVDNGYRLVVNNGAAAGQSVFHLPVHLLGGRAMKWPPG
ncbi:MAG: histidine triad nucleotide-binding protein [Candidatus Binatia bacterium]